VGEVAVGLAAQGLSIFETLRQSLAHSAALPKAEAGEAGAEEAPQRANS
jgi:hypothetical protein